MVRIAILADDLTGAADTAAVFAAAGLVSMVVSRLETAPAVDVVAYDLRTRDADVATARDRTRAGARAALDLAPAHLYKKVDSTLRGHVGVEIAEAAAAMAAATSKQTLAVVAVAFPETGRVVRDGRVHVVAGGEASHPIPVAAALEPHVGRVRHVGLSHVRAGLTVLHEQLSNALADGDDAVVVDAVSADDLRAVATAAADLVRERPEVAVLWVGSGGLARQIAGFVAGPAVDLQVPVGGGRIVAVVGSATLVAKDQHRALAATAGVSGVEIDLDELSRDGETALSSARGRLDSALREGDVSLAVADQRTANGHGLSQHASQALADVVAPVGPRIGALIATGGQTAASIVDGLGMSSLRVLGELEPGVVVCQPVGGPPVLLVTKAGTFGDAQTLVRSRAKLAGCRSTEPAENEGRCGMSRPIILVTMGDPAGVGPEIVVKALPQPAVHAMCRPLVVGDAERLRLAARVCGVDVEVRAVRAAAEAAFAPGSIDVVDLGNVPADLPFGELSAAAGAAAYSYIETAVRMAVTGEVDAICTAPLNKEALHAAGYAYPGHTELLAELSDVDEVSMMLAARSLRVAHVTTHVGLLDAVTRIEPGLVERTIRRAHDALATAGVSQPRIVVCGVNPHAGENGLFGYGEEDQKIKPGVEACRAAGLDVVGPAAADTAFFRAARGDFDVVIAMYHDQGHGPVKVMGLDAGVNITLGLPFVRTSVDHGTAFDIAGTGRAEEGSLVEAIRQAVELAPRRVTR